MWLIVTADYAQEWAAQAGRARQFGYMGAIATTV
jgi:hypothetical protein